MTDKKANFQLFGKNRMIALMKTQFEYFTDLDARQSDFEYMKFDAKSERLIYIDDYDNTHDLYHGIAGGKEVCLHHVNDDRNVEILDKNPVREKLTEKLKRFSQIKGAGEENAHLSNVNNLVHQRDQYER